MKPRGPGSAPTVGDVAAAAGVSRATAARALGGYGSVREPAAARVRQVAAELGYRANGVARSMRAGQTRTLGLVVADIENRFFARATRGFTDAARGLGYEVLLANTDENDEAERIVVKVMLEERVDGLVVAPAGTPSVDHLTAAIATHTPVVLIDRHVPGLAADSVLSDSRKSADAAVSHLLAAGHRRVGIVTDTVPADFARAPHSWGVLTSTGTDRIAGYRAALRRAGIRVDPSYVKSGAASGKVVRELVAELLALPEPPTALFTTDGVITLEALMALQAYEVDLPAQMSLIGFDDPEWATLVRPRLTAIDQPAYTIGRNAAERIVARIRGDLTRPRRYHVPTRLIVRESVTAPPAERPGP